MYKYSSKVEKINYGTLIEQNNIQLAEYMELTLRM